MYDHCGNEWKQVIDDREKDSILYISDSEKDIRIFLEYLKNKMGNNGKECFLDGEHDILKTKNPPFVIIWLCVENCSLNKE